MSFDFQHTQKGFKYDFIPRDLTIELFEASVEFSFLETEKFKITKGMNEFEFTYTEFLTTVEYLIMKYQNATEFLRLSEHLNILSLISGFQTAKIRIAMLSEEFPHQVNKKYIFALDTNRDETVRFVFNLERETITILTNSNTEHSLDVYINISDFNRIVLKLFSLTEFGQNNEVVKKVVSKLSELAEKRTIYLVETVKLTDIWRDKTSEVYRSAKEEVEENHKSWYSSIISVFGKEK